METKHWVFNPKKHWIFNGHSLAQGENENWPESNLLASCLINYL